VRWWHASLVLLHLHGEVGAAQRGCEDGVHVAQHPLLVGRGRDSYLGERRSGERSRENIERGCVIRAVGVSLAPGPR
jgi:hypothetical protein